MTRPPRLVATYFGGGIYRRMARVLEGTARIHCPDWVIDVHEIAPPPMKGHAATHCGHVTNTQKLDDWNAAVQAAPDDERILLIDADTFILRPLDDVWDIPFDIAYTTRANWRYPLNGGVMFVRTSTAVREVFAVWARLNREMLANPRLHAPWERRCAGINQASWGKILHAEPPVEIEELPCREWNCEDSAWGHFDPAVTRIVHCKSELRKRIADPTRPAPRPLHLLAQLWREMEVICNEELPHVHAPAV